MNSCKFDRSWIGPCGKQPVNDSGMCDEHAGMKCCSCGKPATRECEHTGIQFVCGFPLCAGCEHNAPSDPSNPGMFNLGGGHAPRAECEKNWRMYRKQLTILILRTKNDESRKQIELNNIEIEKLLAEVTP